VNDVDLFQGGADRILALHLGGNVDRPELRAEAAAPQARNIGHQRRDRLGDVRLVEVAADVALPERPGVIVVAVDERYFLVQRPRSGGVILCRDRQHGGHGAEHTQGPGKEGNQAHG